jgi:hypothetical protein
MAFHCGWRLCTLPQVCQSHAWPVWALQNTIGLAVHNHCCNTIFIVASNNTPDFSTHIPPKKQNSCGKSSVTARAGNDIENRDMADEPYAPADTHIARYEMLQPP